MDQHRVCMDLSELLHIPISVHMIVCMINNTDKKRIKNEKFFIALILVILFCSCSINNQEAFRSVFPNISLTDDYEKMMGLAPSIEDHETEIIEMSIEGGIEDAKLPENTYSENYKYYQRTYLWDLESKDLQCRATCWCIKEKDKLICAWIETLILKDGITQNETLRFFSPDSSREEIIDAIKKDSGLN